MFVRAVRRAMWVAIPVAMLLVVPDGAVLGQRPSPGAEPGQRAESQRGREALERELERRLANVARTQLGLSDAQFARLQEVNARFSERRAELIRRERSARMALRRELRPNGQPNDAEIERLLVTLVETQRDRVTLLEEEQQALGAFLTPVQRARYLGLQEGFRRQVEERRQGMMGEGRSPRRAPPQGDSRD
jgi:Spy/CpxP family protein refolding chaperone